MSQLAVMPNTELRHSLLRALHPSGYIDMRVFGDKKRQVIGLAADNLTGVDNFVDKCQRWGNVYMGVATRSAADGRKERDCLALHALFADIDFKEHPSEQDARAGLGKFPLKPSAVVHSGGGLHCYWFLAEPIDLQDGGSPIARQHLRRLARAVGGDISVAEPARILRVPGTLNHKYSPPRVVTTESFDDGCRYPLTALSDALASVPDDTPTVTTENDGDEGDHSVPREMKMRLASAWLRRQSPAIQGQNGDEATYKVACAVAVDHDLSEADTFEVMRSWNAQCNPPWPDDELLAKIRSAITYAKGSRGARLRFRSKKTTHRDGKTTEEKNASNLDNVRLALIKLGVTLCFDAFAQKIHIGGQLLDDASANHVWVSIDDTFGFRPSKDLLRTVLETEAKLHVVHPVRDYLDGLRWDGVPRIDTWLVTYGKAEDKPLVRAIGAIVLMAAVRRVRKPGCKFDELLIFESAQGEQKSTALRTLCPKDAWFSDDLQLGATSKEVIEMTSGKWLVEASEMVGSQREADRLKGFLSRQIDGPTRLAYGHYGTEVPRQFIVIGTTNKDAYLKDSTGNRRFWPVRVQRFDVEALRRDRDLLWAEAAAREARGESIRLSEGLWEAAAKEQKRRELMDPWEESLFPTFRDGASYRIPPERLWTFLGVAAAYRNEQAATRLAAIMQRRGFKRMTVKEKDNNDRAVWGWGRGTTAIEEWPSKPAERETDFDFEQSVREE